MSEAEFTYTPGPGYTLENVTGKVRWVERGAMNPAVKWQTLQQEFNVVSYDSHGKMTGQRYEWRDVPLEEE